jgi:hypothetical protein
MKTFAGFALYQRNPTHPPASAQDIVPSPEPVLLISIAPIASARMAVIPATSPSSPSARLKAFVIPTIISTAMG